MDAINFTKQAYKSFFSFLFFCGEGGGELNFKPAIYRVRFVTAIF